MAAASQLAVDKYLAKMAKSYGTNVVKTKPKTHYDVIPTGSLGLDRALGVGGWPLGRVCEIWGPESGGKSTLLTIGQGNAQRLFKDKFVGYIDMEQTYDTVWAETLGLDKDNRFHLVVPDSAEDVADILKDMLESGLYSSIVIDSIGGMVNRAEFEKDAGESVMGKTPQIITRMVKIAAVYTRKYGTSVQVINQVRANLGYGADTVQSGPFGLKHVTSARVKLRRGTKKLEVSSGGEKRLVGYEVAATVEKNKMAPEKLTANWTFLNQESKQYGPVGIDKVEEATTLGKQFDIIHQRGSWYDFDGQSFQGMDPVVEYLRSKPELVDVVREQVISSIRGTVKDDGPVSVDA